MVGYGMTRVDMSCRRAWASLSSNPNVQVHSLCFVKGDCIRRSVSLVSADGVSPCLGRSDQQPDPPLP